MRLPHHHETAFPLTFRSSFPKTIADRVVDQVDESLKADIMHWAAIYVCASGSNEIVDAHYRLPIAQETRMRVGNKKIFHLEAWVVKVMSLYKVR